MGLDRVRHVDLPNAKRRIEPRDAPFSAIRRSVFGRSTACSGERGSPNETPPLIVSGLQMRQNRADASQLGGAQKEAILGEQCSDILIAVSWDFAHYVVLLHP